MLDMNKTLNLLANQSRIEELIADIKSINSASEYIRLKYYGVMIFKMQLLNYYTKESK